MNILFESSYVISFLVVLSLFKIHFNKLLLLITKCLVNKLELDFEDYDEMLEKINNADSYEAIVEYLKKHDYFGVEYVLPAVEVLTEKEKDSILELGGKLKRQASNINKTM